VHPLLEPSFLYGAFPPKSLTAQISHGAGRERGGFAHAGALPAVHQMLPLPGHFFDHGGVNRSADGAVYLADCLRAAKKLEKIPDYIFI
jgi:hypothetical protein